MRMMRAYGQHQHHVTDATLRRKPKAKRVVLDLKTFSPSIPEDLPNETEDVDKSLKIPRRLDLRDKRGFMSSQGLSQICQVLKRNSQLL
ncbi:hypothetical protein ACOMHN_031891 [Nucella lapillus]